MLGRSGRPLLHLDDRSLPSLLRDALAGVVLAAFVVPVSMAYAPLAGLPPVSGLHAAIAALVAYAAFGPSRHLIVGPDSSIAPLVAAAIVPLAAADPDRRLALAGVLSIGVAAILFAIGAMRLGFITDLLAKPARVGFLNGIALVIAISQMPKVLGAPTRASSALDALVDFVSSFRQAVPVAALIGLCALALAVLLRTVAPRLPGMLIVVVASIAASRLLDAGSHGVAMLGTLPSGLPAVRLPLVSLHDLGNLLAGAASIAVITLADAAVLSQSLAERTKTPPPPADEEALALAAADAACGLFGGFPVSASSTRTAVNLSAGSCSQLSGLVAAVLIALMLATAPWLLADLPVPALAAVALAAALQLADVTAMRKLWRLRRTEFAVAVSTLAAVVLLGAHIGVLVAVVLSILNFVRREWRPHDAVLGRVPGTKGYHDTAEFPDACEIPGLLLYRFDAPLFFANARVFRERLSQHVAQRRGCLKRVVIAAEPMTDVDTTAADVLAETIESLKADGIEVGFAELKHLVRERLARYGILDLVGEDMLFPTIGSAVHAHVARFGVEWVDWEDSGPPRQADGAGTGGGSARPEDQTPL